MNIFDSTATCIQLKISDAAKCDNCKSWEQRILLNPSKKRNSKCHRPWEFPPGVKKCHDRTIRRVCESWNDMIIAGFFENKSQIPENVLKAASNIEFEFAVLPSEPFNSKDEQILETEIPRRTTRHSISAANQKNPISPASHTPNNKKTTKFRKTGREGSIHQEQERIEVGSPSPFKPINNLICNLENKFSSSLNFVVDNLCGSSNKEEEAQQSPDIQASMIANLQAVSHSNHDQQQRREFFILTEQNMQLKAEISNLRINCEFEKVELAEKNVNLQIEMSKLKNEFQDQKVELENEIKALKNENECLKDDVVRLDLEIKDLSSMKISNYHIKVHRRDYNRLVAFKDSMVALLKHLKARRYNGKSALGRRIMGEIVATHPSVSFVNASEIIMLSRAQLMAELGIICKENDLKFRNIALSSPSDAYLRGTLDETAADVLYLIYYRIFYEDKVGDTVPSIFLLCDKATNGGFIKIVSWYSTTTKRVKQNILDVDRTYGDSEDCAKAM